jgi:hypothetical protein
MLCMKLLLRLHWCWLLLPLLPCSAVLLRPHLRVGSTAAGMLLLLLLRFVLGAAANAAAMHS